MTNRNGKETILYVADFSSNKLYCVPQKEKALKFDDNEFFKETIAFCNKANVNFNELTL